MVDTKQRSIEAFHVTPVSEVLRRGGYVREESRLFGVPQKPASNPRLTHFHLNFTVASAIAASMAPMSQKRTTTWFSVHPFF